MTTVYDVPADKLIEKTAEVLAENPSLNPPEWAMFVKTGVHNERPPEQKNWWHIRAASLLRRVYCDGPVGTERLRTYYGGKKNRGHRPGKKMPSGGAIIRTILQQLQEAGYVESKHEGRVVSAKGRSFLDNISNDVKNAIVDDMPELKIY